MEANTSMQAIFYHKIQNEKKNAIKVHDNS